MNKTVQALTALAKHAAATRPQAEHTRALRILEALLFAASQPLSREDLAQALPKNADVDSLLAELQAQYFARGVNLTRVAGKWCFRTADDLSFLLRREAVEQKRLSKAALETLATIAYHQPVTRAEIEQVRGVAVSRGTLDILLELDWVRMRGRRRSPGRPVTYGTTAAFLNHFGLDGVADLPGMHELKAAGLLDANLPPDFGIPAPVDGEDLTANEDPLENDEPQMPLDMDLPEYPRRDGADMN